MSINLGGFPRYHKRSVRVKPGHPWLAPMIQRRMPVNIGGASDDLTLLQHIAGTEGCYRRQSSPTE